MDIAKDLTGEKEAEILKQRDVFFRSTNGRLKLRYEQGTSAKLIHYDRDDIQGPKLSHFDILEVEDGELLEKILRNSIGTLGYLEKIRHLFIINRTRIHLDIVRSNYTIFYGMEFEVKLAENEDEEIGNKIVEDLIDKFKLDKEQLLEGSYFEILKSTEPRGSHF